MPSLHDMLIIRSVMLLTANMTTYIFKEWVADAGIKKPVSFHTLSHSKIFY